MLLRVGIRKLPFCKIQPEINRRLVPERFRDRNISESYIGSTILLIWIPGRQGIPEIIQTIWVTSLHKIDPIRADLAGQIIMLSLKRPPAVSQRIKHKPEI